MLFGADRGQRTPLLVVALAGAIIGHFIGYASIGHVAGPMHEYLGPAAIAILPVAAAALLWFGWQLVRGDGVDIVAMQGRLTALMGSTYLAKEVLERVAGGHGFHSAEIVPVLAGLAAQPLVAWGLVFLASLIGGVIDSCCTSTRGGPPRRALEMLPARVESPRSRRVTGGRNTRGPPRR